MTISAAQTRLLLLATTCFLLTTLNNLSAAPLAVIGTLLGVRSLRRQPDTTSSRYTYVLGAILVALMMGCGLASGLRAFPAADFVEGMLWAIATAATVGFLILYGQKPRNWIAWAIIATALGASAISGIHVIVIHPNTVGPSDVLLMHESATTALQAGLNPYVYAEALSTDPTVPPGTVIRGYPYPPGVLSVLAAWTAWSGDPRWGLLFSWLVFISSIAFLAMYRKRALLPFVALLGTFPLLKATIYIGWTEPLSLAFASIFLIGLTQRHPGISQMVGIAALATSKQYFLLAVPVVAAARMEGRKTLSLATMGLGVSAALPFLLVGPGALWSALAGNLSDLGARSDSYSLTGLLAGLGLGVYAPPWPILLLLTTVFGVIIGRQVTNLDQLLLGVTLTLAFAFIVGLSYLNYWLLVAGLMTITACAQAVTISQPAARSLT